MKVKNVIKGLNQKYDLEEITIIDSDRVCYSGNVENWKTPSVDMVFYKKQIMEREVIGRLVHCNRKAFIFVGDPCNHEHKGKAQRSPARAKHCVVELSTVRQGYSTDKISHGVVTQGIARE